jgi:AspT/YidE/YbjL antiporter-like protein
LAIGFLVGRVKIGSFSLGTVVGTLLAGVAIGQLNIQVPAVVKYVFFDLFLFTTGYKVGPQFFRGLKKDALPQVALTVVLCVICLLAAFTAAKLLGYDMGTAAGLLAGAFTESTVIGTAGDAIGRLALSEADKTSLTNNIPVAYAVTYLIGTGFIVWFLPNVGPKLMGVNLKEEARKLQAKISGSRSAQAEVMSAFMRLAVRAYRITRSDLLNRSVAELESRPREARVFISRIRRDGKIIEPEPDTVVREGDIVAVLTRSELLMARGAEIGVEVSDAELLDFPVEMLDVVITNKSLEGKSIAELAVLDFARGVFLKKLTRTGQIMPFLPETRVERGDLVTLIGSESWLPRPQDGNDGHDLRRSRYLPWRDARIAHHRGWWPAAHPYRQRGRADHGPGIRLAASGSTDIRPDPRVRHVDIRHRRFDGLHGLRRAGGGTQLLFRAPEIRPQSRRGRPYYRGSAPRRGDPLRSSCIEDESNYRPGCLFRSGDDHRRTSRHPRRGAERTARPWLHGTLCDWQYPAYRVGSSLGSHDVVGRPVPAPCPM